MFFDFFKKKFINPIMAKKVVKLKRQLEREAKALIFVEKYPDSDYILWRHKTNNTSYRLTSYNKIVGIYKTSEEAINECIALRKDYVAKCIHDLRFPNEPYRIF